MKKGPGVIYIYIYSIAAMNRSNKCQVSSNGLFFSAQSLMLWVERAFAAVGVLRELSLGLSCPFHCGGSCVAHLLLGLVVGLLLGCGLGFFLVWTLARSLYPSPVGPSTAPTPAPRLRGYLHEQ